ncbi:MAG: membrane protein insertion efficiency factor YidD [Actinomycetes bacterium]
MTIVRSVLAAGWHAIAWVWNHTLGFVLTWILIAVIRSYQLTLSKLLPPSCRFHPSCSAYGLESMKVHGALKGTALTGWRLLRCNPWNDGGIDPVPPAGRWLPDVDRMGQPRSETMGAHHSADTNV